jgi:hypothetical protein
VKLASLRKPLVQLLGPPLAALIVLGGLIVLGKVARDALREQDRFTMPLADITCDPPPDGDWRRFRDEVQYLGGLPTQLRLLDQDLPDRLSAAFAKHPWVEKVERVEVAPPGHLAVRLVYRTPVLAVLLNGPAPDGQAPLIAALSSRSLGSHEAFLPARAVDGAGTLLPATAPMRGLPVLYAPAALPTGPAGGAWADPVVVAAARTAAYLRPYQDRLRLEDFDLKDGGLVLSAPPDARVLWGHAPGAEEKGEASASEKVERLLRYCREHGGLGRPKPQEHDVRPKDKASHRPLPKL